MKQINIWPALVLASLLAGVSCKKEPGAPALASQIVGTWQNNVPLPVIVENPFPDTIYFNVIVQIEADGRYFSLATDFFVPPLGAGGNWEVTNDGRDILFTPNKGILPAPPKSVRWQVDSITEQTIKLVEHTQGLGLDGKPYHWVDYEVYTRL